MKYYVTSDTHGFYSILMTKLENKGFFSESDPHKLIILGDLMDRGDEAIQMQEFILDLIRKDEVILIRGNHEDLFEELLTDDDGYPLDYSIQNGTYGTALQLTGFNKEKAFLFRHTFVERAKNTPFYKEIMPIMRDYFETEHYIFTHGWIPCLIGGHAYRYISNWRNACPDEWRDARWINGMYAAQTAIAQKTVVCGHWSASFGHSRLDGHGSEYGIDADYSPYYGRGVIGIDGCTAYSGVLNCIIIEDQPLSVPDNHQLID